MFAWNCIEKVARNPHKANTQSPLRPSFSVPFPHLNWKFHSRHTIAFNSFTAEPSTKFTSKPSSKAVLLYETVSSICGIKACVGIKLSAGPGASGTSTHEKSEAKRECERTSARLTNRMPNSNTGVFTIMTLRRCWIAPRAFMIILCVNLASNKAGFNEWKASDSDDDNCL